MGIRLALGAGTRQVFLLVVGDGMRLVAIGIVLGLAAGFAGARSISSFLYDVPTADLRTFAATTVVLGVVALVACMIPARRAMRVQPASAIRSE
jgi:putative ABC transport system permease protein